MAESWDEYAAEWDSNPDVRNYAEKAFQSLVAELNPAGLRILDFGCGTGLLSEKLAPRAEHILAIDSSPEMTKILKQKNLANVTVLALELTEKALKDTPELQQPVDLIVASSVCAFLDDYPGTLKLLLNLLKPGSKFIQWDWASSEQEPDFGLSRLEIQKAQESAGLKSVSVKEAFDMESENRIMRVLMGIGEN